MIKIWKSKEDKKYGYYQIVEVSPMLEQLRYDGGICGRCIFTSSNGYKFYSQSYPNMYNDNDDIFLMGSDKRKDNNIIKFPLDKFDDIIIAFKEFEEHFKTLTL